MDSPDINHAVIGHRPPRLWRQGALFIALVALALAAAAGCAGGKKGHGPGSPSSSPVNSQLSTRENLTSLANGEQTARADSLQPRDVPVPPGVDPAVLERRDPADASAGMDLKSALLDLQRRTPSTQQPADSKPMDDEARAQALKFYVRGREAALDNRHLVAATELQKALDLDPDSPQIMRELARSYLKVGNSSRAVELFERLTQLDPTDSEALFTVGLALANRREFARAATMLGALRAQDRAFDHDPVADILADFTLAMAMRELGYDRASIEAGLASLNLPDDLGATTDYALRLGSVYRQRGESWRAIGDAYCRLGEYDKALQAYETSSELPTADPSATHPRMIYANLRLGRVYSAQKKLLSVLEETAGRINDRDIRLCAYLAAHAQPADLLSRAATEMYRSHPDDAGLVRAAASLLQSDVALALLREFVERQPRDVTVVSQLLAWLAQDDLDAAVGLTVALTADYPDMGDEYSEQLAQAVPRLSDAVLAVRTLPESAARARVEARLLGASMAIGEAWTACAKARQQWPTDHGLRVLEIRLAAALEEPALLKPLAAQREEMNESELIALARAQRLLNQHDVAVVTAELALERGDKSFDALVELARAHASRASAKSADGDKSAANADSTSAREFAEQAMAIDPARDEPYEVLAAVLGRGGPFADTQLFHEAMQRLYQANPNSPLYARLAAEEAIGQRRYEQALERLVNLCENNPSDNLSLRRAILAWERWGRLDAAVDWLERRLAMRPGDPALMEQWVFVKLRQDLGAEALAMLESERQAHPDDLAVRGLLEQVYRATGDVTSALELGQQRLLARPEGMRREVELAALYAGAAQWENALARLEWIRHHVEDGTEEQLTNAISIAGRIEGHDARRNELTLDLVQRTIVVHPNASLEAYGSGLRALARMNRLDETFDALADAAATNARGATGVTTAEISRWIELAQALVQDEQPAAAAKALRARIRSTANPLPDAWYIRLCIGAFAADAASPDMTDQTMALARQLQQSGALKQVSGPGDMMKLSDLLAEASNMYTLLGNRKGAEQLMRASLAEDPDQAMILNNLGYARLVSGHKDAETERFVERAWELMPGDANILDTLGWLRYRQGRFADEAQPGDRASVVRGAVSLIQASLDADIASSSTTRDAQPHIPSPEVLDHLGDAKWRLGDRDGAKDAWTKSAAVFDDRAFEESILRNFLLRQTQGWGLLVGNPQEMYDREYGSVQRRVKSKLQALDEGTEPEVAPTFAEESHERASGVNP
jgi:tetratricopeptide (TPR) repeat protein